MMKKHTLMILDPGHFHAALPLKYPNPRLNNDIYVYAPPGRELENFLTMVESFNLRPDHPTCWQLKVCRCDDSLARLLAEKPGDIAILAGKNHDKAEKIAALARAGINVLADKPLVIDAAGLACLREALDSTAVIADMMTARHDILFEIQRALVGEPDIFGSFNVAVGEAISIESTHCLSKQVAGRQLIRPAWYFNIRRQGEGIVDVSTHYTDLVLRLLSDDTTSPTTDQVKLRSATHWPTMVHPGEFTAVTGTQPWPEELSEWIKNNILHLNANGEIMFEFRGVPVKIRIEWRQEDMPGTVEGVNFICRGTKAMVAVLRQPGGSILTVIPVGEHRGEVAAAIKNWQERYKLNGTTPQVESYESGWRITPPAAAALSHENQFASTLNGFFDSVDQGSLPQRDKETLLLKYTLLEQARVMAGRND